MQSLVNLASFATLVFLSLTNASPTLPYSSSYTSRPLNISSTTNSTTNTLKSATATSSATSTSTLSSTSQVTGPTLLPAVHWEYPVDDIRNLAPINSSDLYYTANGVADPGVQHLFASMSTTFQYESVVLDHSSYIQDTSCGDDGILVTFTTIDAFEFASNAWALIEELVLVTYTDGCGSSLEQRTFWLTAGQDSMTFQPDTNSILVKIEREIAIEDALHGVDLVWGTYHPPSSDGGSSGGVQGASGSFPSNVGDNGGGPGSGGSSSGSSGGSSPGSSGFSSGSGSLNGNGLNSSGSGSGTFSSSGSDGSRSGSIGSNGNSTATSGSSCGSPPSTVIDGFPAAPCGASDFDRQLDNALGYLDFTSADYESSLEDFMPGVSLDAEDLSDDDASIPDKRGLIQKRGFFSSLKSFVKKAASVITTVATAPIKLAQAAVKAIPVVGDFIAQKTTVEPKVQGTADIKLGPNDNAVSPWGNAALLFSEGSSSSTSSSNIALYCVNCGFKGHVVIAGSAKFNILDGLNALTVGMNANIEAGLNLGLVASATFSQTKKKSLINQAIPDLGVSVKGVFSAGVFVAVDAVATLDISAAGQALIGVTMLIPDFQATLNLLDADSASKSSITGYTPQWKKRFEASGQITASARLALPVSLNVGLEIIPIKFKKSVALIEQPSLYGNISFAASAGDAAPASDTCNNGFSYFANAQNDILLDFLGLKTFTLNHYDSPPLLQGCQLIGGPSSSTSTAVSGSNTVPATSTSDASPESSSTGSPDSGTPVNGDNVSGTAAPSATDTGDANAPTDTVGSLDKRIVIRHDTNNISKRQSVTKISEEETDTFDSDPTDNSDTSDDVVGDDSDSPDNDEFKADSTNALAAATNAADEDGFNFTTIVEYHSAFQLAPDDNGNLYAVAPNVDNSAGGYLFAASEGIVVGDDQDRSLHYYPDVMAAYGVSRIRMSFEDEIPKTADVIALAPQGDDPTTFVAVDSQGNGFSLVLCNFSNGADSKIFIVADESGLDTLKTEKLRYTVTGAPVTDCEAVALVTKT